MADEESQDISDVGGSSENAGRSPEIEARIPDVAVATESNLEEFEKLKKNVEGMCTRLDNIHKFMLDLGNYFFAFQGVCLAAISNTSFFVCHNPWFLTFLSILSAIPSLAALGFLAHEWIGLMKNLDTCLTNFNALDQNMFEGEHPREYISLVTKLYSVLSGGKYSYMIRYLLLMVGVIIIISFTASVAAWPHVMICKGNARSVFDKKGFN